MNSLPPAVNVKTNPTGYMAAAGTIYAAAVMIYNASHHGGVIDVPVIIAAVAAVGALLTRQIVTPVAAPRDGNGNPLAPVPEARADSGTMRLLPPVTVVPPGEPPPAS